MIAKVVAVSQWHHSDSAVGGHTHSFTLSPRPYYDRPRFHYAAITTLPSLLRYYYALTAFSFHHDPTTTILNMFKMVVAPLQPSRPHHVLAVPTALRPRSLRPRHDHTKNTGRNEVAAQ